MKTLTIIIPVYNESERIHKTLTALMNFKPLSGVDLQYVYFVNDGSTDNTVRVINKNRLQLAKHLKAEVRVISYSQNQGKGHAIKVGMNESNSDYTLFMDVDMSTPLTELAKFVPLMNQGKDVIVGTRKNGHSTVKVHQPLYREILGRGFTLITNIILNTWVTDFTCGFKAFSREAKNTIFTKLVTKGWSFDAEALFLARKAGLTIQEVPVEWSDNKGSKVNLFRDLPKSLIELVVIRLTHGSFTFSPITKPVSVAFKTVKNFMW